MASRPRLSVTGTLGRPAHLGPSLYGRI